MIDELEKHRRKRLWINKETYAGIFVARLIETTGNFRAASVPGNSTPHCPHFTSRTLPFHQSAWCSGADSPILLRVHVERWDIEVTWSYLLPFCNVINCKDSLQSFNPYPTAFPYGNGMVLHFYQQQESSTTKTVHKVINKGLKTYV